VLARLTEASDLEPPPRTWTLVRGIRTDAQLKALWSLMQRGFFKVYQVSPDMDPGGEGGLVLFPYRSGECDVPQERTQLFLGEPEPEPQGSLFNPALDIHVTGPESALAALDHPQVLALQRKALRQRPKHPVAVLVPCAQRKPYRQSPSHAHGYLPAVEGLDVDLIAVSEPLGCFPYAWSDEGIATQYEFAPAFLKGPAKEELTERIRSWLEAVGSRYDALVLALPRHHGRLVERAAEGLDLTTVDGSIAACHRTGCPKADARPTSHAYRRWLRKLVQRTVRRYSRPRRTNRRGRTQ